MPPTWQEKKATLLTFVRKKQTYNSTILLCTINAQQFRSSLDTPIAKIHSENDLLSKPRGHKLSSWKRLWFCQEFSKVVLKSCIDYRVRQHMTWPADTVLLFTLNLLFRILLVKNQCWHNYPYLFSACSHHSTSRQTFPTALQKLWI